MPRIFRLLALIAALFICCFPASAFAKAPAPKEAGALRLVSVIPSYTEIIFALGAGKALVGVSNYCDYPPEAKEISKIGDYYTPSAEKIYLLRPSLVFLPKCLAHSLGRDLSKLKIKTIIIPEEKSLADIFRSISLIAQNISRQKEGRELIASIKANMPKIADKPRKVRVYIDIDSGLWTCGQFSYLNDIVEKAGGKNIFAAEKENYFQADWESVLKAKPEFILSLSGNFKDFSNRPLAKRLPAILNGQILKLPPARLARPAPSVFSFIKKLNAALNKAQSLKGLDSK